MESPIALPYSLISTSESLWHDIGEIIESQTNDTKVKFVEPIKGGCINQAALFRGEKQQYFVKYNDISVVSSINPIFLFLYKLK